MLKQFFNGILAFGKPFGWGTGLTGFVAVDDTEIDAKINTLVEAKITAAGITLPNFGQGYLWSNGLTGITAVSASELDGVLPGTNIVGGISKGFVFQNTTGFSDSPITMLLLYQDNSTNFADGIHGNDAVGWIARGAGFMGLCGEAADPTQSVLGFSCSGAIVADPSYTAANVSSIAAPSGGKIRVTTATPHNLVFSQSAKITGVTPAGFNGNYTCSPYSDTQVDLYPAPSSPGAYVSGGTLTAIETLYLGGQISTFAATAIDDLASTVSIARFSSTSSPAKTHQFLCNVHQVVSFQNIDGTINSDETQVWQDGSGNFTINERKAGGSLTLQVAGVTQAIVSGAGIQTGTGGISGVSGGSFPVNMGTGALTCGTATFPGDATKGPLIITGGAPSFLGTTDPVIQFGYNLNTGSLIKANENGFAWTIEGDYNDGSGHDKMEGYLEYVSADGTVTKRPIFFQVQRDNNHIIACNLVGGTQVNLQTDSNTSTPTTVFVAQSGAVTVIDTGSGSSLNANGGTSGGGQAGVLNLGFNGTQTALTLQAAFGGGYMNLAGTTGFRFYSNPAGGNAAGALAVGGPDDNTAIGLFDAQNASTNVVCLRARQSSGQTVNTFEAQNHAQKILVAINANGVITAGILAQTANAQAGQNLTIEASVAVDGSSGHAAQPGGNLIITLAAGVNSGAEGIVVIQHNDGTPRLQFTTFAAATDYGAIYLGNVTTPGLGNYFVAGNASETIYGDGGTGHLRLRNLAVGGCFSLDALAGNVGAVLSASSGSWLQNTSGEAALANNFTDATGTLAATNLAVTLQAGRSYRIEGYFIVSNSTAADGFQMNFAASGGLTVTTFDAALQATGSDVAGTVVSAAIGTVLNYTTITGTNRIYLRGYIKVNAAGTLTMQAATNTHVSGTMTLAAGSWLAFYDTVSL